MRHRYHGVIVSIPLLVLILLSSNGISSDTQIDRIDSEKSRLEALRIRMHKLRSGQKLPDDDGFSCLAIRSVGDIGLIVDGALLEDAEGQRQERHVRFYSVPFDYMFYGPNSSPKNARRRFLARLDEKIEDIHRIRPLSDAQKSKLRSAGRLDIAKFFLRVERLKTTFDEVHVLEKDTQFHIQRWLSGMIGSLEALQLELQGNPFGEGSVFQKAFQRHVADERSDTDEK